MIRKFEKFVLNEAKKEQDDKWIVKEGILKDAIQDFVADSILKKGPFAAHLKKWEIDGYKLKNVEAKVFNDTVTFDVTTPLGDVEVEIKIKTKLKK